ncbi:MAG: DUF6544 family protein [Polyangiales bacterium]
MTILLLVHGAIHGLGFVKAFSLAAIPQLTQPISRPAGVLWLIAGLLVIASAVLPTRWLWLVGGLALIASQAAIGTAWSDAKLGTLANLVLLLAVVYSFASTGPLSFAVDYQRDAATALKASLSAAPLTDADLAGLPTQVQRYVRASGAIGAPRVYNLRARWRGRMRGSARDAWMPIEAEQLNTFAPQSVRLFHMRARMKGVPVDVFHRFVASTATFRVRLLSMIPIVEARGPELSRAETVTILNDMCLLAPAALIDPALRWRVINEQRVGVTFTRGAETVHAELRFDADGQLEDFASDDRLRASPDGKTFTRQRWSTPTGDYRSFAGRRVGAHGRARWHAPEGAFDYADFELEAVEYNVATSNR